MTIEDLANLAEIIGLLLVVASLIYVGRQLRQNTEMIRAESRNSIQQNHQQEILIQATMPEIWRGFTGEELSDEGVKVNMWLTSSLRSREYEWIQHRNGALDSDSWNAFEKAIPLVLSSELSRSWWAATRNIYDTDFADMVDELLERENFHAVHIAQAAVLSQCGGTAGV